MITYKKLEELYERIVYHICLFLVGRDGIYEEWHQKFGKKERRKK